MKFNIFCDIVVKKYVLIIVEIKGVIILKKILKEKCKKIINYLKNECTDSKTLILFLCVIVVMYMPVWGGYLLYFIFKMKILFVIASMVMAFWVGPFTPFFPFAIAITLFIKKFLQINLKKINS